MSDVDVSVDYKLEDDTIKKMLKEVLDEVCVKIGILGENGTKKADSEDPDNELTTATLGAIQEFGTFSKSSDDGEEKTIIPARSFLRMPIEKKLTEELLKSTGFRSAVQELDVAKINDEIGMAALAVIDDAFDSGGFGEWAPLADATVKKKTKNGKKGDAILIDTGNLRRSITYEVIKNGDN